MIWEQLHPKANIDMLGYIPSFLSEADQADARTQLDKNYAFGGFQPFYGFTPSRDFLELSYPHDPPTKALFRAQLRDEWVYVYEHAWVLVRYADGSHVIARMD